MLGRVLATGRRPVLTAGSCGAAGPREGGLVAGALVKGRAVAPETGLAAVPTAGLAAVRARAAGPLGLKTRSPDVLEVAVEGRAEGVEVPDLAKGGILAAALALTGEPLTPGFVGDAAATVRAAATPAEEVVDVREPSVGLAGAVVAAALSGLPIRVG